MCNSKNKKTTDLVSTETSKRKRFGFTVGSKNQGVQGKAPCEQTNKNTPKKGANHSSRILGPCL